MKLNLTNAFLVMAAALGIIGCKKNDKEEVIVPTSIEITPASAEIKIGETANFTAKVLPENAKYDGIIWSSVNPAVASVENGVVTALAEGTTTIIATVGSVSGTASVTVIPEEIPADGIAEPTLIGGLYYQSDRYNPREVWVTETPEGVEKYSGDIVIPSTITYQGANYSVYGIGDWAFSECDNLKSVILEEGLKYIEARGFYACKNLKKLALPASFDNFDYNNPVFTCCSKLEITVDESNPQWYVKDDMLFRKTNDGIYLRWLFEKNTGTVTIPDGTNFLHDFSICDTNIDKLIIPASVSKIECRFFDSNLNGCKLPLEIELNWTTQEQVDAIVTFESDPSRFYFDGTDRSQVTASVPNGTKGLYETHWLWSTLGSIVERP